MFSSRLMHKETSMFTACAKKFGDYERESVYHQLLLCRVFHCGDAALPIISL